jgi:hypothetical protein
MGWPHWRADHQIIGAVDNQGLAEGVDLLPGIMLGELAAHAALYQMGGDRLLPCSQRITDASLLQRVCSTCSEMGCERRADPFNTVELAGLCLPVGMRDARAVSWHPPK